MTTGSSPSRPWTDEGRIGAALVRLALPSVGAGLLKSSFAVVDTWSAARLSTEALTGLTAAVFFGWMFHSLASMTSIGTLSHVARAVGSGDSARVQATVRAGLQHAAVLGGLVSLVFFVVPPLLLDVMGLAPEAAKAAAGYLRVLAIAGPGYWLMDAMEQALRASGDAKTPLKVQGVAALVNLALNPLLALGWGPIPALGLVGIGVATGVAWTGGAIALAVVVHRRGWMGSPSPGAGRPSLAALLRVGLPVALTGVSFDLIWAVMTPWVTATGPYTLPAIGVGHRLESVGYLAGMGVGHACAALVGQALGAGQPVLARRIAARAGVVGVALVGGWGVILGLFDEALLRAFTDDAEVIALGVGYVAFALIPMTIQGLESVMAGAFEGVGRTGLPNLISVTCYVARLPLVITAVTLGPVAVFGSVAVTASAAGVLVAGAFFAVGLPARAATAGRAAATR